MVPKQAAPQIAGSAHVIRPLIGHDWSKAPKPEGSLRRLALYGATMSPLRSSI
jgi:hypothetical protein